MYRHITKNRSSNLSDFPSSFYTCALESFPAWGWDTWRKPGKTLRGSFSINTGGALSPPAAHNKLAGSCFPCLDRIRTGIMPDMSRGMTGGPRTRYIHPQTRLRSWQQLRQLHGWVGEWHAHFARSQLSSALILPWESLTFNWTAAEFHIVGKGPIRGTHLQGQGEEMRRQNMRGSRTGSLLALYGQLQPEWNSTTATVR